MPACVCRLTIGSVEPSVIGANVPSAARPKRSTIA
jgi:hypothetical protein